jgi:spoIIIJ-associated protein
MSEAKPESRWKVAELQPQIEGFLRPLLKKAGLALDFQVADGSEHDPAFEQPDVTVRFTGRDLDLVLANKAELLLALEHITLEFLRARPEEHNRLLFDAADYRLSRVEELRLSAEAAADKVKRSGMAFKFGPMNSRERRILHLALRGDAAVRTESEGLAPHRHVIVYPAGAPSTNSSNRPAP